MDCKRKRGACLTTTLGMPVTWQTPRGHVSNDTETTKLHVQGVLKYMGACSTPHTYHQHTEPTRAAGQRQTCSRVINAGNPRSHRAWDAASLRSPLKLKGNKEWNARMLYPNDSSCTSSGRAIPDPRPTGHNTEINCHQCSNCSFVQYTGHGINGGARCCTFGDRHGGR